MAREHVRPRAGLVVRDPVTLEQLPAEGKTVDTSETYWARRVKARDVVKGKGTEPKSKSQATAPKTQPEAKEAN